MVKKVAKRLAYSLLGIVLFLILAAGYTQTQFFRDQVRSIALSRLDSVLDADIYLGTIGGNLVTNLSIDSLSIRVGGEEFVSLHRIELQYDPFQFARRVASFQHILLVNPRVRFVSDRNGKWNFNRMIRATPEDTSTSSSWQILLDRLEIQNGSVGLVDSAALLRPDHPVPDPYFVEYHDFLLNKVNLHASVSLQDDNKEAVISKLTFVSRRPSVELLQLSGEFSVTPDEARVKKLVILTSESSLDLDASMKQFNLLKHIELSDFKSHPVDVSLRNSRVNLDELKRFIPQIAFLGGETTITLAAGGEFGDLQIKRLDVSTGQTVMHAKGYLYNLHQPQNLYLDVKIDDSAVYGGDVLAVLPGLDLPDYTSLGLAKFSLKFQGTPRDFETGFDVRNNAGRVQGDMKLAIGGPNTLAYKGDLAFRDFNVAPLLKRKLFESSLNGSARIEGSGVDLQHLLATMSLKIDSSTFLGNRMRSTDIRLRAAEDSIGGSVILNLGSMDAAFTAAFGHPRSKQPTFRFDGRVSSLHLEELLGDTAYSSDITMKMNSSGEGVTWSDVNGVFQLEFLSSRYREYQLDSGSVRVFIDQHDLAHKELTVQSTLADFSLTGVYDLEYLGKVISYEIRNLGVALNEKFAVLDSSRAPGEKPAELAELADELAGRNLPLNANFELAIKNLEPVSILTQNRIFNGVGTLKGVLSGRFDNISLHAQLDADELYYGNVESGFFIQGGTVRLDVKNLEPVEDPFGDLEVHFMTRAQDLHLSRTQFDSLGLSLTYQQGYARYTASGRYNNQVRFVLNGLGSISEDLLVVTLNELRFAFEGQEWAVDGGSAIGFGVRGARIRDVVVRSNKQVATLSGFVGIDGEVEGKLSVGRINLANLKYLMEGKERTDSHTSLSGYASIDLKASGTFSQPVVEGKVEAREVALGGLPFGEVLGEISYEDGVGTIHGAVVDDLNHPDTNQRLIIDGTVPIGSSRATGTVHDVNLSIKSDGVQIGILDPILPTFDDLSGILRCDVSFIGPPDHLSYHGSFALEDCKFVFVPNRIPYLFTGRFEPEEDRIKVVDAVIRNTPSDARPGKMGIFRITGDFAFRNFLPSDFNLHGSGELLIVKPETRRSSLSVYGDLYVETGRSGLSFLGTLDHSFLRGDVLVRSSSLTFPPVRSTGSYASDYSIPVTVVDDTSQSEYGSGTSFRDLYFQNPNDSVLSLSGGPAVVRGKSFLDGLEYDLNVETSGPSSEIRLIFSAVPVEELRANFQGKWSITGDGKRWIGDLDIDRAYYSFYKQFDATGKLRYTGEFLNPELDIDATYQGTRTVQNVGDSTSHSERVVVTLRITGTRIEPHDSISMTIDGVDYYSYSGLKSSDIESDALAFIIAGTFPLSSSESNAVATDLRETIGASLVVGASSLLTNQLSEYLRRETGFIHSVELGYGTQGSISESADLRVSGTAFKGLWRYQGKILDNPFSNANYSLQYSFGDIFDDTRLRNFMLELERRADLGLTGSVDTQKEVNSARFLYRFSF